MVLRQIEKKYPKMSKAQQKIARYIELNYNEAAFATVARMAQAVGTSAATIVRFCYMLGYSGYSDMQREIRQTLLLGEERQAAEAASAPVMSEPSAVQMYEICRMLMSAKNVIIVGFLESLGTAAELLHMLEMVRGNVYFTRLHSGDWSEIINMLKEDTVLLAVSFEPHYFYTHRWVQRAIENECATIVFTNDALSPFITMAQQLVCFDLQRVEGTTIINISPVAQYIFDMITHICETYKDILQPLKRDPKNYLS